MVPVKEKNVPLVFAISFTGTATFVLSAPVSRIKGAISQPMVDSSTRPKTLELLPAAMKLVLPECPGVRRKVVLGDVRKPSLVSITTGSCLFHSGPKDNIPTAAGTKVAKTFYILQTFANDLKFPSSWMKDRVCPWAPGLSSENQSGPVTQRGGALHLLANEASSAGARESMHNPAWFAVQTRSKHERMVSHHLQMLGVSHYLPIVSEIHRWSDRRKKVELPLFPGYLFVQILAQVERRVEVLRTPGIVRFVGSSPEGAPIPDVQIEFVRRLIDEKVPWTSHPFLKAGQRIRIRGGALDQVEGVFLRRNGEGALIVSIDAIQRSLAVSIQGYDFEVI